MTPSADSNALEKFWNRFQTCEASRVSPHMLKTINRRRRLRLVPLVPTQKNKHISAEEPSEWNVCRMRRQFCSSLFWDNHKRSLFSKQSCSATWSNGLNRYIRWFTTHHTTVGVQLFHEKVSSLILSTFFIKLLSAESHFTTLPINTQPAIHSHQRDVPLGHSKVATSFSHVYYDGKKQKQKCSVWLQNSPWRKNCYKNWDD